MTKVYFAWIVAISLGQERRLISDLVKNGNGVDPLSTETTMYSELAPSCVISLRITSLEQDIIQLYTLIFNSCENNNIKYHAIIVSEAAVCTWISSNIVADKSLQKKEMKSSN